MPWLVPDMPCLLLLAPAAVDLQPPTRCGAVGPHPDRVALPLRCRCNRLPFLPSRSSPIVQMRKEVGERVVAGDIDAALALTRTLAPGLLEADPRIHFRLLCQKFAQMVGGFDLWPECCRRALLLSACHACPCGTGVLSQAAGLRAPALPRAGGGGEMCKRGLTFCALPPL